MFELNLGRVALYVKGVTCIGTESQKDIASALAHDISAITIRDGKRAFAIFVIDDHI